MILVCMVIVVDDDDLSNAIVFWEVGMSNLPAFVISFLSQQKLCRYE